MGTSWSGGCSCGAVRYECSAEPVSSFNCHCKACQKYTGSAFMSARIIPIGAFKITKGSVREYTSVADNGSEIHRGFCEKCGSPIVTRLGRLPEFVGIPAGSMDDPAEHNPTMDLFVRDALPSTCMDPARIQFEMGPPPRKL
ncbi:MAG: GFA family protein [Pontiellaceae bacterium]|nr:GFA family protein [Pontiellaceae bacterium]